MSGIATGPLGITPYGGRHAIALVAGGTATETDTALAGTTRAGAVIVGGVAAETDTALPGTPFVAIAGGVAVDGNIALSGTLFVIIVGTIAIETDTVLSGTTTFTVRGGVAVDGEQALGGTANVIVAGGFATETDAASTGIMVVTIHGGPAVELDVALGGTVTVVTARWTLHDLVTGAKWTMPINPNSMTPIGAVREFKHVRGPYGVTSTQQVPNERALDWSGVIRSQDHYDQLVLWAQKSNAVLVTDHTGRQFRVYITDFQPTDRSPIPRAPKRWRYTMKTKLLEQVSV